MKGQYCSPLLRRRRLKQHGGEKPRCLALILVLSNTMRADLPFMGKIEVKPQPPGCSLLRVCVCPPRPVDGHRRHGSPPRHRQMHRLLGGDA